ncbi:WGxxGxxG family protein [Leptolyngbya sp. CCNP1308]|uniref:WGxxGxxG family protein n=1 Tax=Leptolyngbya sp. CCNP1308 TaxID=3110255 RepID=UPI002B20798C|nr:WGxxGxxG family protein [Leptolyngbya sp. CCNP1308]MEA5452012.1 WGxxGxxG family protein [Leptolyngbya sp. CCNP1308]
MKSNVVSKWVGGSALALGLAVLPSTLPASAQTATDSVPPTAPGTVNPTLPEGNLPDSTVPDETYSDPVTPAAPGTVDPSAPVAPDATVPNETYADPVAPNATTTTTEDDGLSWGWLGLLGLLGLGGLAGRSRASAPAYRTGDRVTTPTSADPRI